MDTGGKVHTKHNLKAGTGILHTAQGTSVDWLLQSSHLYDDCALQNGVLVILLGRQTR